jgi:hypothetical protein
VQKFPPDNVLFNRSGARTGIEPQSLSLQTKRRAFAGPCKALLGRRGALFLLGFSVFGRAKILCTEERRRMSKLKKQERAAIDAVAGHFSTTWQERKDAASISISGKRIALDLTTIQQRMADKPRLRFDQVVHRLIARLKAALHEYVPDGTTVIVTITAPIRLASKTAEALEDNIKACLARRSSQREDTIHGNQIRIRLVKSSVRQVSKVIGLVHNPDSDPDMLLDMAQSLLQHIGAAADRHTPAKERWLVVIVEGGYIETYRQVYSQLSIPTDFKKILMVFGGNRVESLAE